MGIIGEMAIKMAKNINFNFFTELFCLFLLK